jgi:hypothetical protein
MKGRRIIREVRGAAISKIAAAVLVMLAVLPFTAPFSTFDLADLLSGDSHGAVKTIDKADEKIAAVDGGMPLLGPIDDQPFHHHPEVLDAKNLRHVRTVVLRL